ncbi:MAG: selenide, water dikinase SelD [Saprospiraceae bacterium]|nr:selenide, water dikinase SelD [Saprospiraceae bacterium]
MEEIKLTQYSHGAGCGCKIAPKVLDQILNGLGEQAYFPNLLVGNEGRDDAAVMDIGGGQALISTTDFFMPIVDDAFDFGRIAAANSISDVYAMGGKPLMAVAVLGWPVEKLPIELASRVLEGGRSICREAGIPLAGGHSIDSPEPIFGLAVTGLVSHEFLKKNNTAEVGDWLFLTKPLGVGVLTTAQKRGALSPEHQPLMIESMAKLNRVGESLATLPGVTAMTDVTGFGLLGHLVEMADGSGLSAEIFYEKLPVLEGVRGYIAQRIFPDATTRNWSSFGEKISFGQGVNVLEAFTLLPDPQTNGGLLFTVKNESLEEVKSLLTANGLGQFVEPIGRIVERGEKVVSVLQ